ncbi:hypothetical protein IMZ17_15355 [Geobacillus stearothermophilus]|nr:hypothetical protein IMZ17_15355 [Geobacillus stearothermophilus]
MIGNIMRMFTFLLPIVAVFRRGVNGHAHEKGAEKERPSSLRKSKALAQGFSS